MKNRIYRYLTAAALTWLSGWDKNGEWRICLSVWKLSPVLSMQPVLPPVTRFILDPGYKDLPYNAGRKDSFR